MKGGITMDNEVFLQIQTAEEEGKESVASARREARNIKRMVRKHLLEAQSETEDEFLGFESNLRRKFTRDYAERTKVLEAQLKQDKNMLLEQQKAKIEQISQRLAEEVVNRYGNS